MLRLSQGWVVRVAKRLSLESTLRPVVGRSFVKRFPTPFPVVAGTSNANPFQYTGRENDATGIYFYRARYYHPALHRFPSEDPIESRSGSYNLFSYVNNNPINQIDPSGKASTSRRNCTNTSPECDRYGPCDQYQGANARCFCKCMGDDDWSQAVRCCLRDLDDRGFNRDLAHAICWSNATMAGFTYPAADLDRCYEKCKNEQTRKCEC